jgi:cytoskeleton protein RodZ
MTPKIGQALREARTERGIELTEVERVTKIRVKFLRAMEEDRWAELPAPVYARSFLSTYARFVGLDDEALVEEYDRTVEGADRPEPIPAGVMRPGSLSRGRFVKPFGMVVGGSVAAALLVLIVVALVSSGGGGDGDGGGGGGEKQAGAAGETRESTSTPTATAPAATESEVSLQLRPTAEVWVCLVDAQGRPLVNGELLAADQARGPFAGREFEMRFGNGSIEMTVDGQPVKVPALAEPLGYRVNPSGARRIDTSEQPTCV